MIEDSWLVATSPTKNDRQHLSRYMGILDNFLVTAGFPLPSSSIRVQRVSSGRLLIWAVILAATGGIMFVVGLSAAFGRAGNWSELLAFWGIAALFAAGVMAIAALWKAIHEAVTQQKSHWALPLAVVAAALALWGGWVAINL